VIHARHFGGFTADEGAAGDAAALGNALDDAGAGGDVELAGGVVVEEEQRLGTLDDDVVDAHGDEVDADGGVAAGFDGDPELGADAIVGGDEDGIGETGGFQIEQAAETADLAIGAGTARGAHGGLDGLDKGVARVYVDAGLLVR
jgi:hypothetical protein